MAGIFTLEYSGQSIKKDLTFCPTCSPAGRNARFSARFQDMGGTAEMLLNGGNNFLQKAANPIIL